MRVAYHFTVPLPARPELDAACQDALRLQASYPGEIGSLYPAARFHRLLPPRLFGLRHRGTLARLDGEVALHHLFSHGLHRYPALDCLRKPIVYTLVPTLRSRSRPRSVRWFSSLAAVVTASPGDRDTLAGWGVPARRVTPGIDLARFHRRPPPPHSPPEAPFVLLAGSAPWDRRQLATKGYRLLFAALREQPGLRLVLLLRGVLVADIEREVRRFGIAERVEIVRERADVDAVLARTHAAIVLAESPQLVKAYPHSLLEALAAGRPVVVSGGLAMADYVREAGCGVVVDDFSAGGLSAGLGRLIDDYANCQQRTAALDLSAFSVDRMVAAYGEIYREVAGAAAGAGP